MAPQTIRKGLPTPADVHVDTPLTNLSVAFMQQASGFVADRVFPNVPVEKQSDKYYTYDRGYFNRDEAKLRAPGTESAGSGYTVATASYACDVYAFHHDIDDQRRANSDSVLAPDREATELVTVKGLLKRETLWATNYFATSKWTTDVTGGTTVTKWDDAAGLPVENIDTYKATVLESTGYEPNTLVVGYRTHIAIKNNPNVLDRLKYGQTPGSPAMATEANLAALFGVDRYLVMRSIQNTAAEGAANVHAFIGGKHALLVYAAPAPSIMTPSGGYTFSWRGYLRGAQGQTISRFRMEHLKSDRVEMEMAFAQKLISADLGVFFSGIVD